jgi:ArsR family transcriptional regulator
LAKEVKCVYCGKAINPEDARVKDGNNVYCIFCYGKSYLDSVRGLAGKEQHCAACGKVLTRYDDKVQDGGKIYCKACSAKAVDKFAQENLKKSAFMPRYGVTSLRDNVIECAKCGAFFTADATNEDKDGKLHCPKCGKKYPSRTKKERKKIEAETIAETAQLFKCLGDPCRVKIIELLSDHELCVFEFVDMLGFQYSAVSYHLKMLKEMGLVKSYERGNFMVYSLTDKGETVHEFIDKSKSLK